MRREDGKTSLEIILILVITIIIVGVIVAMVYEKPKKQENTTNTIKTTQNTTDVQSSINDNQNSLEMKSPERPVNIQNEE